MRDGTEVILFVAGGFLGPVLLEDSVQRHAGDHQTGNPRQQEDDDVHPVRVEHRLQLGEVLLHRRDGKTEGGHF